MKTGAQLYTVRAYTQTEKDFSRTMEKNCRNGLYHGTDLRDRKRDPAGAGTKDL